MASYKITYSNELYHHGILGQKWGKRNGPPYPLGEEDKSAKEKKEESKSKRHGLTDKQKNTIKKVAIGAGVALAIGGGAYLAIKYGNLDSKLVNIGKEFTKTHSSDILGIDDELLARNENNISKTVEDLHKAATNINPTHSKTNCGSCSTAVLYNMLGGNVQALPEVPEIMRKVNSDGTLGKGYDPDKLIKCFNGNKQWTRFNVDFYNDKSQMSKKFEKEMLSYGEGSCGIFYIDKLAYRDHGHYMPFKILNGKVCVIESQPASAVDGAVYNNDFFREIGKLIDFDSMNSGQGVSCVRLDDTSIKPEMAKYLFKVKEQK